MNFSLKIEAHKKLNTVVKRKFICYYYIKYISERNEFRFMNTHILANTMNRRLNSCDNRPTLKASTRKVQTFNPFILIIPDIKL